MYLFFLFFFQLLITIIIISFIFPLKFSIESHFQSLPLSFMFSFIDKAQTSLIHYSF